MLMPFTFRRAAGFAFAGTLCALSAHAQVTLAGFTADSNGYQNLKIGSNYVADDYDNGTVNSDPSKQSQLNGTNKTFDLVGNSTYSVIQVATGTVSGASAVAVRVRLANDTQGFKAGGAIALFKNGSTVFGVGVSVKSNNAFSLFSVTSNAGTTFDAQYQFTLGSTAIATNSTRYSYTAIDAASGGSISTSGDGDAFLTFVVLQSELQAISPGFSFSDTTGVSVFTNGGGNGLTSGNINMDFLSSDGTATGSLAFGSTSGSLVPVPEFSTAAFLGLTLLPALGLRRQRRRVAVATS